MLLQIYGADRPGEAPLHPRQYHRHTETGILGDARRSACQHILHRAAESFDADGVRPFTRLTNAHSKKIENHGHAIALHFMH